VRRELGAAFAVEPLDRGVAFLENARHPGGEPLGGDQRVGDAARGQRVGGRRGVAEQHGAGRPAGACSPGNGRATRRRGQRRRAIQPFREQRFGGDPAHESLARAVGERVAVTERREQQLAVGQRRNVQLVAASHEDLEPVGADLAFGESEVHTHADARSTALSAFEAERSPHRRFDAVGADDQPAAPDLVTDDEPDRAAVAADRAVHGHLLEHAHPGRRARRADQHVVEPEPPLGQRREAAAGADRERALHAEAEAVVADAAQPAAAHLLAQPEALEHADPGRHDALAARLLAREASRVEHVDPQPGPPEQDRQRGAGRPGARD